MYRREEQKYYNSRRNNGKTSTLVDQMCRSDYQVKTDSNHLFYYTNSTSDSTVDKNKSQSKIYSHIKKAVKQPMSPGGRLSTFLNSLFHNTNKTKNLHDHQPSPASNRELVSHIFPKTSNRELVSHILPNPPLPLPNACTIKHRDQGDGYQAFKFRGFIHTHHKSSMLSKPHGKQQEDDDHSDSSSDLFELDHLNIFGNELPLYETTRFDTTVTKRGGVN
ncbi:hypothetical protein F511_26153 [Dorcoceras hygrometricum]|uniref:Protein BIG GRAIN 1-like E n=1 Tax=Dorcoceras hygrometricum TaxID=472368 RepID=A0A2Z7AMQ7_9LAMI|nr:hypothetical protein F511_26153 [Dorcoceras hygrometricum]